MNAEEARRSTIRKSENQEWLKLLRGFDRERGEVLRKLLAEASSPPDDPGKPDPSNARRRRREKPKPRKEKPRAQTQLGHTTSSAPLNESTSPKTPENTRRHNRRILSEDEVQQRAQEEVLKRRLLLEQRRLQNLLALREMRKREREERDQKQDEIELWKREKAEEAERREFEAKLYDLRMANRVRSERLKHSSDESQLPPIASASEPNPDTQLFAQEADQRRKRAVEAERQKRLEHDARIQWHIKANLEFMCKQRQKRFDERDEQFQEDFEKAHKLAQAEEEERAKFIEALKEREQVISMSAADRNEERRNESVCRILEQKLEQKIATQEVEALRAEKHKAKQGIQAVLRQKMIEAGQELRLRKIHEAEESHVLTDQQRQRRRQAEAEILEEKAAMLKDREHKREIQRQDMERLRRIEKNHRLQIQRATDAFYEESSKQRQRKPRVPEQKLSPIPSPARLPPHPELNDFAVYDEAFAREVASQIAAADRRSKGLRNERI